ncbi:hypothetical protein HYPGJ_20763 [Hyphomicrobium sp. GJ21]|nr:hypothetical protein HYPGJ_20763 [Hyphomicrobium sp. GJ21]
MRPLTGSQRLTRKSHPGWSAVEKLPQSSFSKTLIANWWALGGSVHQTISRSPLGQAEIRT